MKLFFALLLSTLSACTNLFFHPHNIRVQTPEDIGITYHEIVLRDEGRPDLVGWYLPSVRTPVLATIVFLHGNAENISTHLRSIYWLTAYGFDVVMAEYRGYGASAGSPEIAGVHEDARRFLRYAMRAKEQNVPVLLYGQSLGATIALRVASENEFPLKLVIAESAFKGYQSMALDSLRSLSFFRYLFSPAVLFISNRFNALDVVDQIHAPVLLVHGTADTIVPFRHSEDLHARIPEAEFWSIENRGHLDIFNHRENRERLIAYLTEKCEQKQPNMIVQQFDF